MTKYSIWNLFGYIREAFGNLKYKGLDTTGQIGVVDTFLVVKNEQARLCMVTFFFNNIFIPCYAFRGDFKYLLFTFYTFFAQLQLKSTILRTIGYQ